MWQSNIANLQKHLKEYDISTFMEWSTIRATMYVGLAPYIPKEFEAISRFYPLEIVRPVTFEPANYQGLSTNLIHQAYHLLQLESQGVKVKDLKTIVEFGGGYGAMALIIHRLGFKGDYCIYDYPELERIQDYYLGLADIEVSRSGDKPDLLIAAFSLSEVNDSIERWRFLHRHPAKNYLFVYGHRWYNIDNHQWFGLIQQKRDDLKWINRPIKHLPGRFYLVGF